jgi:predicted dehydrogenase
MSRLRVAVIGVGHLGKEHARILGGMPDVDLVGVADVNAEQAQAVARRLNTQAFSDFWPLLNLVDAASIVVPTMHHKAVATEFLRRKIPLLVEKPLAANHAHARALVELAGQNNTILQVGHIERFNPAFEELQRRPLQPKFVTCERLGPFTGRSTDIGVVFDLMIHDLDLLLTLVKSPVVAVEALGICLFGRHEDVASARLSFANGCVAQMSASRASPTPLRHMQVWSPEGFASIDFSKRRLSLIQPSAALRQNGLDPARTDAASRARLKDELFARHLETLHIDGHGHDQLTCELRQFVECVQTGATPRVSGRDGLAAVNLAENILDSIRNHSWTGQSAGPTGPNQLPPPLGVLFPQCQQEEAA